MSNISKGLKKVRNRIQSKIKLGQGAAREGALLVPGIAGKNIAATQAIKSGDYSEEVDTLKETSNPENNFLSVAMTPDLPQPEETPVIPIPDESLQANEARRRRARRSRTGRESTILTGLGG